MTRESKFRGQRTDTKEWVYGYLFRIWDEAYILWGTTNGVPNMIEVIPETVGQYAGLNDTYETEIYEGDIVECYQKQEHIRGHIVFEDACFFVKFTNGQRAWIDGAVKQFGAIIIGNCTDNPELIPKEE